MRIFYSDINSIKSEKLLNVNMLKMEKKYDIQNTFMAHGILFIYAHKKLHASLTRAGMNILLIEVNWNLKGYVTSSDHTQSHLSWTRPAASMMTHRSEFLNYNQFFFENLINPQPWGFHQSMLDESMLEAPVLDCIGALLLQMQSYCNTKIA